jgi:hypothetical protein
MRVNKSIARSGTAYRHTGFAILPSSFASLRLCGKIAALSGASADRHPLSADRQTGFAIRSLSFVLCPSAPLLPLR